MFFWGSYNFQFPQMTEHPNRPSLRFPVYVPPTLTMMNANTLTEDKKLICLEENRIIVKILACGQKHFVAVASYTNSMNMDLEKDIDWLLYGMGSNHSGQLGHRVPEYTTALTRLYVEELMSVGSTITSIACGNKHTLIGTSSGTVFAAGDNSFGQLGVSANLEGFSPVRDLAHIKTVFASGNVSFALNAKGQLFSWGEAQFGHLGHGDNGERMDSDTLRVVKTNVMTPQVIQWFVRRHVVIVDVSVGKTHIICRSSTDDVYTMGDNSFGKLGSGNVTPSLSPLRVQFPERAKAEKLCGIAAGDDHSLVLFQSSVVGSVVYYFGRLGADGQRAPIVVPTPSSITRIAAGRGNQCIAVTAEGRLYVWGKHSYQKVSAGTPASAMRSQPSAVKALEPFIVTDAIAGGAFVVAIASTRRELNSKDNDNEEVENVTQSAEQSRWDVVIPHDDRIAPRIAEGKEGALYEDTVRAFLSQYLGTTLAAKYIEGIPPAPPATNLSAKAFTRVGAHSLTVGQKVRLWMTDVYALGSVSAIMPQCTAKSEDMTSSAANVVKKEEDTHGSQVNGNNAGYRLRIEWQRDDWHDEEITLYSEDETIDEENFNRWQPLWFLQEPSKTGDVDETGEQDTEHAQQAPYDD